MSVEAKNHYSDLNFIILIPSVYEKEGIWTISYVDLKLRRSKLLVQIQILLDSIDLLTLNIMRTTI